MSETIEQICIKKGVKLTDQRKIIAKVLSESKAEYGESDHPDVDELYSRVSKIDPKINYNNVFSLSSEGKDKLIKIKPSTIGDASRISGVSSSDVSILMLYLSSRRKK